ncbi:hypothetical protein ACA910_012195 [Epithemia clementina (nom. ined.)]
MGCSSSKPQKKSLADERHLLEDDANPHSPRDMMKADPTVTQAAKNLQNNPHPNPAKKDYGAGPAAGPNTKKGQTQTYNRAKDRVDAIPESKMIETKDIRLRYAYLSQRGFYPDDPFKPNQDSYCVHETISQTSTNGVVRMDSLFGVFDGHGKDGDGCAQFARANLPGQLKIALDKAKGKLEHHSELNRDQIQNAILRAHVETNQKLHKNPQIDDSLSGTTAITAYFHGRRNRLTIANVGDSRAVLGQMIGSQHGGGVRKEGPPSTIRAYPLSRDQTPYRKDERVRVRATGARILSLDQLEGLEPISDVSENDDDFELGEELDEGGDPPRVWAPNGDYPGTAFTRSIGDAMAEDLGVFAEPEMLTREITQDDRIIVLASDGVFEFLTNQSVIDICAKFGDPLEACRAVVAEAYELWLQYELRTDDITIIVIFIDDVRFDATSRRHSLGGSMPATRQDLIAPGNKNKSDLGKMHPRHDDEDEDDEESDEEEIENVTLTTEGLRPVRKNVSKEKSKEIAKLRALGSSSHHEEENFDLSQLATVKTEDEKRSIEEAIKASVMFRNINDEQRQMIYSCMESVKVEKGTWVIKQGTVGDNFYIIDEGQFEVRILPEGMEDSTGEGGNIIHVYEGSRQNHIHPAFGELALMYSAPRSASIVAKTDGHLWALHRAAFRQVLIQAQDHRKELKTALRRIQKFKSLDSDGINKLAAIMDEVTFGRGENIIEQGHKAKCLFVIKTGSCYTIQMLPGETRRGTMKAGSYFGDEIFSSDGKYSKTVVSLQTTTCWQLEQEVLTQTMGPLLKSASAK